MIFTKKELRQRLLAARSLTEQVAEHAYRIEDKAHQDHQTHVAIVILRQLAALFSSAAHHQDQRVPIIALYYPIGHEINLLDLAQHPALTHVQWALSQVVAKAQPLQFLRWQPDMPLVAGAYGIPIPIEQSVVTPDIALIPCVGWQQVNGRYYRLGYGGGFYDRTLAAHPALKSNGIAMAWQETTWQLEPYDAPLDELIIV